MAKIDLDSLSIEELASLRDTPPKNWRKRSPRGRPNSKRNWKSCRSTASRRENRQAAAPVAKAKKSDDKKSDEAKEPIAKAA